MSVKAQLFITCLADQFYPGTLERMVELLDHLDVEVEFSQQQTCCGQPFFNSGFQSKTRGMARQFIHLFARTDGYIVSPSGSCVDMVRHHYPALFPEGTPEHKMAREVAGRTVEFAEFLVDVLKVRDLGASYRGKVTYHASCHGLRGLGLKTQAKELLNNVKGLELVPLEGEETCCGFGGVFSVVYPEVSRSMMDAKLDAIEASGAGTVVACDAGCLMNIGGGLHKRGDKVKAKHLIDVLAAHDGEAPR